MALIRTDIEKSIHEELAFSKKQSVEILKILIEIIKRSLEHGENVLISGFGKFSVKEKKQRRGRNPATGEDIILAKARAVTFRPSDLLREKINKGGRHWHPEKFDEQGYYDDIRDFEAEHIEAERKKAERIEAERKKAERIEAERKKAERIEAERKKVERKKVERIEAERIEAERKKAERYEDENLSVLHSRMDRSYYKSPILSNRRKKHRPLGEEKRSEKEREVAAEDSLLLDEGVSATRYPSIDISKAVLPGRLVKLAVDLRIKPDDQKTRYERPVIIDDLSSDWKEILIQAHISSRDIDFEPEHDTGIIVVRRRSDSYPWRVMGILRDDADLLKPIEVRVTFYHNGRFCGSAARKANVTEKKNSGTRSDTKVKISTRRSSEKSTGQVDLVKIEGQPPHLTVEIIGPAQMINNQLRWLIKLREKDDDCIPWPAQEITPYPKGADKLFAETEALIRKGGEKRVLETFEPFGERIYELMAEIFRSTYQKLCEKYPTVAFPIQFVCDDLTIPWEFARPPKIGNKISSILAFEHPVARWFINRPSTPQIESGSIVAVVPEYPRAVHKQPTENIILKNKLQKEYGALPIDGQYDKVMELLYDQNQQITKQISIFVFAGHGSGGDNSFLTSIHLDDCELAHTSVDRQEVSLGKRCRTLVLFNACQTGGVQNALGSMTGWAAAFANRNFGGFFAPFWSVYEHPAANFVIDFLANLKSGKTIAEAAYIVRRKYSKKGLEHLAYTFYGDVNSRIR